MIQSVTLSSTATLAAPGDALLQVASEVPERADFGAFLALNANTAKPVEQALANPAAAFAPIPAPLPALPVAAPTGNILPLALPVITAEPAAPIAVLATPDGSAVPDQSSAPAALAITPGITPDNSDPAPPARPAAAAKRPVPAQHAHGRMTERVTVTAQLDAAPADPQSPNTELAALPEAIPIIAAAGVPNAAIAAVPIRPAVAPAPSALEPAPAAHTAPPLVSAQPMPEPKTVDRAPQPAPPVIAHAAPHAAFLRVLGAPVPQPEQAAETQPPTPQSPAPRSPAPASPAALRIELAVPHPALLRARAVPAPPVEQPAAIQLTETQPAAARPPAALRAEIALPVPPALVVKPAEKIAAPLRGRAGAAAEFLAAAVPTALAAPVQQAALAAPTLITAPRPLDFAALVDRLVAAREAVQPPGALLTVAHAEFGPVELRFRHDERGLAVSLANADPDFARVAAAATPPQLPPSAASLGLTEPGQPGARSDSQSATNGSATSNSRGQQSDRRGDAPPQSNHHPRSAAQGAAARRSGIFA